MGDHDMLSVDVSPLTIDCSFRCYRRAAPCQNAIMRVTLRAMLRSLRTFVSVF